MDCTLNTLFSTLEGKKPLNEQRLVGTPFGGLYSTEKINPGVVWGLFNGCVKYFAPDYSESMRRGAIANFLMRLVPRIDVLQTALSDFKDLRLLQLQAKPYDDRKFRQVQQELAQVTVRLNIFFKYAGDIDEMRARYNELVTLFQNRVPSEIFTAHIPQDGVVDLLEECWHEYQDYRWVPRLQREVGTLPVSKLRQIVENDDFEVSRDGDLKRFINNLNKAHLENLNKVRARLKNFNNAHLESLENAQLEKLNKVRLEEILILKIFCNSLIMIIEAMDGVSEAHRGGMLGKIAMRLEDAGCQIFTVETVELADRIKETEQFWFDDKCLSRSGPPIVDNHKHEILVPVSKERSLLFSTVNVMRLCIDLSRVGHDAEVRWSGLNILPIGRLNPSGDCALVEGSPRSLVGSEYDRDSLVSQLKVLSQRDTMPAGQLAELLCVMNDSSVAWNLRSNESQPVKAVDIEEFLGFLDPEATHEWMQQSGLGARVDARSARQTLYAELEQGKGTLWDKIVERSKNLSRDVYAHNVKTEIIRAKFKAVLVPQWFNANGVINHFSKGFLDGIQGLVVDQINTDLAADRVGRGSPQSGGRSSPQSGGGSSPSGLPRTPTKTSRRFSHFL